MHIEIVHSHSFNAQKIKALYENAFPLYEQRPWLLQELLIAERKLQLLQINSDNQFIGFVTYWQLRQCIFIEHFAIHNHARGNGLGSEVMKQLANRFDTIILETEPASASDEARRRIAFYERLGCNRYPFPYQQPAYQIRYPSQNMELLYYTQSSKQPPFEELRNEIYCTVYNQPQ